MKFDKLEYRVAEMMGPPQSLTVNSDGRVRYESHSNNATPDTPEIGLYETQLPPAEMEHLSHVLDTPPFQSLSDHWGKIASGDRYKRITLIAGAHTIEKMVGTTKPVDTNLAEVISQLDQIVTKVMKHPRRTLRMDISQVAIDASAMLNANFELSNGGSEVTDCINPISLPVGPGLSIRGWPDKPPAEFGAGEVFRVNVEKVTDPAYELGDRSHVPVARISPGSPMSFHISARLPVPTSGDYLIQLAYQSSAEEADGHSVIVGELFSKLTKINVRVFKPARR